MAKENTIWVENPANEIDFWNLILEKTNKCFNRVEGLDELSNLFRASLSNDRMNYLFIPDFDRVCYNFDSKDSYDFGHRLRQTWQTKQHELFILGSVKSENSKFYKATLNRYQYPFWDNLLPIHLD